MKPTILLTIPILCCAISFGQEKKEILNDINNKYTLISRLVDANALRQYYSEYTCESLVEKGTLTFYYNSRELKYVSHQYMQNQMLYEDEYYVWNNQLIFGFSTHKMPHPDYRQKTKTTKVDRILTIEELFYFDNSAPIACQIKSFETRGNDTKNTKYLKNHNTGCTKADKIIEKYQLLLQYQDTNIENSCRLPRSISKIISDDVIYSVLGKN